MEDICTGFSQLHNSRNKESMSSAEDQTNCDVHVPLPGFRFHPTDEELVGFYLRRKVEKRPVRFELIKQIDIYKHDPWELTSLSGSRGDETELYFYCKRGRKYKNSIRPNRVTGSGFWKATGIDKPVHSHGGQGHECIGLKKTLVYYRGTSGKGSKTDWMMHEFRLPTNDGDSKNQTQEAEIWTLCRIFKRNASQRKHSFIDRSTKVDNGDCYINFSLQVMTQNDNKAALNNINELIDQSDSWQLTSLAQSPSMVSHPSFSALRMQTSDYHWDELRSVVQSALDPSFL